MGNAKNILIGLVAVLFLVVAGLGGYLYFSASAPAPVAPNEEAASQSFSGQILCATEKGEFIESGQDKEYETCRLGLMTDKGEFFYLASSEEKIQNMGFSGYYKAKSKITVTGKTEEDSGGKHKIILVEKIES